MPNTRSLSLTSASSQYAHRVSSGSANLNIGASSFAVEAWFNVSSLATQQCILTNIVDDTSVRGPSYKIYVNTNGSITGQCWDNISGFLDITSSSGIVSTGTWYHVMYTWDQGGGNTRYLFFGGIGGNDTQVASTTTSRSVSAIDKRGLRLGANEGSNGSTDPDGQYFGGLVDEVRLWSDYINLTTNNSRKLTQLVGNETSLVAYYQLNNDYIDTTGNGETLSGVNSPSFSPDVPFDPGNLPGGNKILLLGVS